MNAPLIQSRFKGVYLGLMALWAASSLGVWIAIDALIVPNIKLTKAQQIESLVRSHQDSIQLNDSRSLRDELLRQNIISDDRSFETLRPAEKEDQEKLRSYVQNCTFINERSCIGNHEAIVLSNAVAPQIDQASFAILLNTNFFNHVSGIFFWKFSTLFGLGLIFVIIAWAIRQQEKFLLNRIGLFSKSLMKVESFFVLDKHRYQSSGDELTIISKSLEQAANLLEEKTGQIESYKTQFEKKARLEQLAQTITYTSHNLKAPLQEGAEFLRDLPQFIEKMPRENLIRAIKSLERRLKEGAESLQEALNTTKASESRPEKLNVATLLKEFESRISSNPSLSEISFKVATSSPQNVDNIFCNPSEIDSALWNLVKNSIEAKRDSCISIESMIDNSEVIIHFKDNGPGIPEEVHGNIFEDFYTTKSQGTGLGLASVKRSIERSRGTIRVLPADQGAHFEIKLPLIKDHDGGLANA